MARANQILSCMQTIRREINQKKDSETTQMTELVDKDVKSYYKSTQYAYEGRGKK